MGNNLQIAKLTRTQKYKQNSVICIVGANLGVGKELAIQYSKRICRLFLIGTSEESLNEIGQVCKNFGSQVKTYQTDVKKEENCKEAIKLCIEEFGQLDILLLTNERKEEFLFELQDSLDIYKEMMESNYYSAIYLTKAAWPYLNQSLGQIVVLSSLAGEMGLPNQSGFCGSKFALTGFFESLRIEQVNRSGSVGITIVCPPLSQSSMNQLQYQNKDSFAINNYLSMQQYAQVIIQGADRRVRKLFFPTRSYLASYARPFFPDIVDRYVKLRSKL